MEVYIINIKKQFVIIFLIFFLSSVNISEAYEAEETTYSSINDNKNNPLYDNYMIYKENNHFSNSIRLIP